MKETIAELRALLSDLDARLGQAEEDIKEMRRLRWNIQTGVTRLETMRRLRLAPPDVEEIAPAGHMEAQAG